MNKKKDKRTKEEIFVATHFAVVKECEECGHRTGRNLNFCESYEVPEAKWRWGKGGCPLFTARVVEKKEEKFVNPLKASKRQAKGR